MGIEQRDMFAFSGSNVSIASKGLTWGNPTLDFLFLMCKRAFEFFTCLICCSHTHTHKGACHLTFILHDGKNNLSNGVIVAFAVGII